MSIKNDTINLNLITNWKLKQNNRQFSPYLKSLRPKVYIINTYYLYNIRVVAYAYFYLVLSFLFWIRLMFYD